MASPRQVITDLHAWAGHFDRIGNDQLARSLQRGAEVIDQQQAELAILRAYAEIPVDEDAA